MGVLKYKSNLQRAEYILLTFNVPIPFFPGETYSVTLKTAETKPTSGLVIPTLRGWKYHSTTFYSHASEKGTEYGPEGKGDSTTQVDFTTPPNHTVSFAWVAGEGEEGVQSETPSTEQPFSNEDETLTVEADITSWKGEGEEGAPSPFLIVELVPVPVSITTGLVMLL